MFNPNFRMSGVEYLVCLYTWNFHPDLVKAGRTVSGHDHEFK